MSANLQGSWRFANLSISAAYDDRYSLVWIRAIHKFPCFLELQFHSSFFEECIMACLLPGIVAKWLITLVWYLPGMDIVKWCSTSWDTSAQVADLIILVSLEVRQMWQAHHLEKWWFFPLSQSHSPTIAPVHRDERVFCACNPPHHNSTKVFWESNEEEVDTIYTCRIYDVWFLGPTI
jgi:hypothetical protein